MLIDGELQTGLPADDRGLLYGDGLFETIAVRDGQPLLLAEHLQRLLDGCQRLGIPSPSIGLLRQEALQLSADQARAVLKIIVTRGSGGRGYRPPSKAVARRILSLHAWPEYPADYSLKGVEVRLCKLRLGHNPALAGIKHLNRLEQVIARAEWSDESIAEGLLLDQEESLIEGTMSNIFLYRDGCLLTPQLQHCGVLGIMRQYLLQLADELGIPYQITSLGLPDVMAAEQMFLCNSVIGLWPVRLFSGREYAVDGMVRQLLDILGERGLA